MKKIAITFFVLMGLFPSISEAFQCPETIEVEISGMEFAQPGDSYEFDRQYRGETSKVALAFHREIEAHVIDLAGKVIKEPFTLTRSTERVCEYQGNENVHMFATIEKWRQPADTEYSGNPEPGEDSLRLVIRLPVNLVSFSRKFAGNTLSNRRALNYYIWGYMNFIIWVKEDARRGIQVTDFDNVSAMLKYQVDYGNKHFDYPLGISTRKEVRVSSALDTATASSVIR